MSPRPPLKALPARAAPPEPSLDARKRRRPALQPVAWRLDWNLLRTFVVIVEEKSLTGAALRLDLKQPSVSNALKRLEESLGTRLVDRGPRTFRLTASGRALYRECSSILGSVNRLDTALEEAEGDIEGTVNLSMASHVATPLLDDTIAEFHRLHPATCLNITILRSREVEQSVFEKRASLGICLVHEPQPELHYQKFYTEHFGFYCGPRHRLFGKPGLELADLRGEHCVSFVTDQLKDALRPVAILRARAELDRKVSGLSSSLEEIRRMVLAGIGIGALPIHVVERDVREGLLFRLPPYEKPPAIDIWVVRHPQARVGRAEAEFTRLLLERIEATPANQRVYGLGETVRPGRRRSVQGSRS